jgi:hypothetical protein
MTMLDYVWTTASRNTERKRYPVACNGAAPASTFGSAISAIGEM